MKKIFVLLGILMLCACSTKSVYQDVIADCIQTDPEGLKHDLQLEFYQIEQVEDMTPGPEWNGKDAVVVKCSYSGVHPLVSKRISKKEYFVVARDGSACYGVYEVSGTTNEEQQAIPQQ